jgi:hypothetical protein
MKADAGNFSLEATSFEACTFKLTGEAGKIQELVLSIAGPPSPRPN